MNKGLFISALTLLTFASAAYATPTTQSLSPYDVVVPSLKGDPAANARVVGQLYYDVSSNSFKGIDGNGNPKTFLVNSSNLVKSGSNNERMERLTVLGPCTSDPCTVNSSSSSWFTSVSRTGTGEYVVNFSSTAGSSFSSAPTCTVTPATGGAAFGIENVQATATNLTLRTFSNSFNPPVVYDGGFQIICMGTSN